MIHGVRRIHRTTTEMRTEWCLVHESLCRLGFLPTKHVQDKSMIERPSYTHLRVLGLPFVNTGSVRSTLLSLFTNKEVCKKLTCRLSVRFDSGQEVNFLLVGHDDKEERVDMTKIHKET